MTLSRTARILIGVLLLAAAAFFWVNFFSREQATPAPAVTGVATAPAKPVAAPSKTPSVATNGAATAAPPAAAETAPANGKAPVVAPSKPAVATHDLQVAQLPFLVTQPPQPQSAGSTAQAATGNGSSSGAPGQVAASAQRMTVNPFAPILVQAAAAPKATAPTPPPTQQVTTQQAPKPRVLAQAPAPQPVAPPPPQASGLPGALPSGMLPTTPSVLQTARAQATSSAPKDLGSVAAVREPGASGAGDLGTIGSAGLVTAGPGVPGLLGPGQPTQAQVASAAASASSTPPLQAGTDSLSLYLRDHNVRFTGSVLGPVSVGVFRSDQYPAPVVVSLGQVLPKTKITLTDLRGHEAVFSYQNSTQSLSLDLRR
ncbi:MAG TPA: hypothetical protein VKA00_00575 [Trueperaceae bacterium]|nr:hypothetical protein [Trueperaceae bacterium]